MQNARAHTHQNMHMYRYKPPTHLTTTPLPHACTHTHTHHTQPMHKHSSTIQYFHHPLTRQVSRASVLVPDNHVLVTQPVLQCVQLVLLCDETLAPPGGRQGYLDPLQPLLWRCRFPSKLVWGSMPSLAEVRWLELWVLLGGVILSRWGYNALVRSFRRSTPSSPSFLIRDKSTVWHTLLCCFCFSDLFTAGRGTCGVSAITSCWLVYEVAGVVLLFCARCWDLVLLFCARGWDAVLLFCARGWDLVLLFCARGWDLVLLFCARVWDLVLMFYGRGWDLVLLFCARRWDVILLRCARGDEGAKDGGGFQGPLAVPGVHVSLAEQPLQSLFIRTLLAPGAQFCFVLLHGPSPAHGT